MTYKVLIPETVAKEGIDYLLEKGYKIKMGSGATEEDLIRDVEDCDAILLRTAPCTKAVMEAGKKLKIIARHGAGYNNVDLEAAERLGIWVTNCPDSTTNSVAEFTLGAIIAVSKRTFLLNDAVKRGDFFYKNTHKGMDLAGKTLAILGLGRIGRAVAQKAFYGLGMKILAYDPYVKPEAVPDYVTMADWDAAFSEADVVSVHMPLTRDSQGCIGQRELEKMKPSAYFVNCARGGIVNDTVLADAVENGRIAGAFTDVFGEEPPLPDNPLLHTENVSVTPHMASNTKECMIRLSTEAASQIHLVLSGQKPAWPLNHVQTP